MQSNEDLRSIFHDSNKESLLLETGFRKPLTLLTMDDKPNIKKVMQDHHTLIKVKPELDQFAEGLKTAGVLDKMRRYSTLMAPMFVTEGKVEINKGFTRTSSNHVCMAFMVLFMVTYPTLSYSII